jgi:hypothetical protein
MGCSTTLAGSIIRDCLGGNGGVKEIKVKPWDAAHTGQTVTSGVATFAGAGLTGWKTLECEPETSNAEDPGTTDPQTGTTIFDPSINYVYNKRKTSTRNAVNSLHGNRWLVLELDENDEVHFFGYDRGMFVPTSSSASGTAHNERNGGTVNFKGREKAPYLGVSNAWSAFIDA